ncbi:MAG TPA: glutamine synthetase family protein [Dongiaceae bacterium]|jgi:glutamine synthetase|nr:glutamine synthetase family protein [Dongiaceae bacterium]
MNAVPDAPLAQAQAFLDQHPEITAFQIFMTNFSGVPRGKNIRRHELLPIFEHGRYLPGTMLVLDITGEDVDETGLVWEDGDADRLGKPISHTLSPMPWLGEDMGQLMLSVYELDNRPCRQDPRHILRAVVERFAPLGLTPVVACELEFTLFDQRRDSAGRLQPPLAVSGTHRQRDIQVYGLSELDDLTPFLQDLYAACLRQDIPAETAISEYAPGQMEITLRHRADALRAADDAVRYKRTVKGIAQRHGMIATFMAKPASLQAGNGMHLHASLADRNGNAFASEDAAGTPLLRHAIGGMMRLLPDSMAIFAPNANSYRRFQAKSYAPVAPNWGINNRTVSLRVPAGPAASRHIEHRMSGADANPYLALAAMLAGMHYGITHEIDPGTPVSGNGYAQAENSGSRLPTNWVAAVEAFTASAPMQEYLGEDNVRIYGAIKHTEQQRFLGQVTELDYDWYLRNA